LWERDFGRLVNLARSRLRADECRRLLDGLRDDTLRQVALRRMEGCGNDQVSERIGVRLRTVERKLDLIRKT
jgi:DNA-directed RNA polymerase specialized sigma24 family protein